MKVASTALLLALAAMGAAAQPAAIPGERPNQPVYRAEGWTVIRSVREKGGVVACTGMYRRNPHLQLSADNFIIKTPAQMEIRSVAIGFDDEPRKPRPLTPAETELHALVLQGADFERLVRSHVLNVDVAGAAGRNSHRIELRGIEGAIANIKAGCPVPDHPLQPRRRPQG